MEGLEGERIALAALLIGAELQEGPGSGAANRLADDFVDGFSSVGGDERSTNPPDRSKSRTQFLYAGGALQPVKAELGAPVGEGFRPVMVEFA